MLDFLKFDFIKDGLNELFRRQQFKRGALTKSAERVPSAHGAGISARRPHKLENLIVRGRERELARLQNDFATQTIIVIDGLAGIGKTTLAEAFAETLAAKWRAVWVDCRAGMSLESLTGALAIFLGPDDSEFAKILKARAVSNPERAVDAFIAALDRDAEKPIALFLDDFHEASDDQVIACDLLVESRKQLHNARLVILTRDADAVHNALRDPDPRVKPRVAEDTLGGLDETPALEMLRDLGVTQDDEILKRLNFKVRGHPIALKLGAGLLNSKLTIAEIEQMPLFQRSGEETQSLKRILRETDQRLSRDARTLIQRLTVFDEPFDQAEAVLVGGDKIDALAELQTRFVVTASATLLEVHPLVREYFYFDTGWYHSREQGECHKRAGQVYTARAQKQENERTRIAPLVQAYKHFQTGHSPREMLGAFGAVFETLLQVGQWDEAYRMAEESLAASRNLRDAQAQLKPLYAWGAINYRRGKWDVARRTWEEHLQIAERLKDEPAVAQTYNNLGSVYADKGEWDKAIEFYQKDLAISEKVGDIHGMAQTYNNLGLVYAKRGEWDKAIEFYQNAIGTMEKVGDIHGMAQTYNNLGLVYADKGEWDKAIEFYQKDLAISEKVGDIHGMAITYANLSEYYKAKDDLDTALRYAEKALGIFQRLGAYKKSQAEKLVAELKKAKQEPGDSPSQNQ